MSHKIASWARSKSYSMAVIAPKELSARIKEHLCDLFYQALGTSKFRCCNSTMQGLYARWVVERLLCRLGCSCLNSSAMATSGVAPHLRTG
jgi:hypothetical protein